MRTRGWQHWSSVQTRLQALGIMAHPGARAHTHAGAPRSHPAASPRPHQGWASRREPQPATPARSSPSSPLPHSMGGSPPARGALSKSSQAGCWTGGRSKSPSEGSGGHKHPGLGQAQRDALPWSSAFLLSSAPHHTATSYRGCTSRRWAGGS